MPTDFALSVWTADDLACDAAYTSKSEYVKVVGCVPRLGCIVSSSPQRQRGWTFAKIALIGLFGRALDSESKEPRNH